MHANTINRHLLTILSALLMLTVLTSGCAKQDLYEPPGSPYTVVGKLGLPSINEAGTIMGRTAFVAGGEAGLHTVDWSTPSNPILVSTVNTTKYADDIQVVRTFTQGVMRDIVHVVEGTEGVTSFNVTDPANVIDYNTGTTAVNGRTIYIDQGMDPSQAYQVYLAEDWKGVRVFDSEPGVPGTLGYSGVFVGTNGKAYNIAVRDGWGYCADNEMGICVLDLRVLDLDAVSLVSWADTPGQARAIALEGDYAYIADATEGLAVFRINEGDTPVKVAQYDLSGFSEGIAVRDGLCALAANTGGVHFMDVSNPSEPIYMGTTATSYAADLVFSDDGYCIVFDEDEGVIILGGRGPFDDNTPPSLVSDLVALPAGVSAVDLTWTMTGDNRMQGEVASYELRMSTESIVDEAGWEAATPLTGLPDPEISGTPMAHTVSDLDGSTTYHFAMKMTDNEGLVSELSNAAEATTAAGIILRNASLDIQGGLVTDTYTFTVEALWESPFTVTEVVIDGTGYTMSPAEGSYYTYQTTLDTGIHTYSYQFDAADAEPVETEEFVGPVVGEYGYLMGSPVNESGREIDEVQHTVLFTEEVIATNHEVTQAEWDAIMPGGSNPSQHLGADNPVDSVTWLEAVQYCNALSEDDDLTPVYTINGSQVSWNQDADGWRLPTEAEWEYLCRAGSTTPLYNGDLVELNCRLDVNLDAIGWYCGNAGTGPEAVEQKTANDLGLYDMSGNVREWCWDWYGELTADAVLDPTGPESGDRRICRGGSWYYNAQDCRSAARGSFPPDSVDDTVGFRVVRTDLD